MNCRAVEIRIDRQLASTNCVMGYLSVDGNQICYSLELPDGNNAPYVSCVPAGTYKGIIRTDGDKGWRIELTNVPKRPNVQIHVGNYTSQTRGCTLVGTGASVDSCSVEHSADAMAKLKQSIQNAIDTEISVTYSTVPEVSK
ncbi:MAG TPA: DUF5675 family protein [Verrucomicrobiae bacterium]